jgi:hypothetical protein
MSKTSGSDHISPNLVAAITYAGRGLHVYPSFPSDL